MSVNNCVNDILNKRCNACSQALPTTQFSCQASSKDGLQATCKQCQGLRQKARREQLTKQWNGDAPSVKTCCRCKVTMPASCYGIAKGRPDGLQSRCKACASKAHRLSKYGIDAPSSDACDICGESHTLSIDHCHTTGQLRGTLCRACNTALGLFRDSDTRLERAKLYLTSWRSVHVATSSEHRSQG